MPALILSKIEIDQSAYSLIEMPFAQQSLLFRLHLFKDDVSAKALESMLGIPEDQILEYLDDLEEDGFLEEDSDALNPDGHEVAKTYLHDHVRTSLKWLNLSGQEALTLASTIEKIDPQLRLSAYRTDFRTRESLGGAYKIWREGLTEYLGKLTDLANASTPDAQGANVTTKLRPSLARILDIIDHERDFLETRVEWPADGKIMTSKEFHAAKTDSSTVVLVAEPVRSTYVNSAQNPASGLTHDKEQTYRGEIANFNFHRASHAPLAATFGGPPTAFWSQPVAWQEAGLRRIAAIYQPLIKAVENKVQYQPHGGLAMRLDR